MELLLAFHLR